MIIICAKLFINPNIDHQVMGRHKQVSLKSMHNVEVQTVTLTFDLVTWFLFMTYCLVMMIICASRTAKLRPGHDSGTHKHTHTDRVNSICPSAISWRGNKKHGYVPTHSTSVQNQNLTSFTLEVVSQ